MAHEKFSSIQTSIQFMRVNGQKVRSILITSANKGEGKTFFCSNFALTCSQFQQKTLVIDTDFYSPKMSRENLATGAEGLSNVLIGDATLDEAVMPLNEYLDFLPVGVIPPNPLELIKTQGLEDLLKEALEKYEMVIFDCPPVNIFTDARVFASLCDLGILVVSSGKTTEDDILTAKNFLEKSEIKAIGTVLNNVKYNEKKYDYYGY
nr:CpsD/CapB family tyrosine-protein kinase [Listeria floridensis]